MSVCALRRGVAASRQLWRATPRNPFRRAVAERVQSLRAGGRRREGTRKRSRSPSPFTPCHRENVMNRKSYTLIGAAAGLALFLALALLPSLLYGGYAGVLLAGGIFGTPVKATFLVRALIVFGMVLGVVSVGSLFAVGGAAAGAAVATL